MMLQSSYTLRRATDIEKLQDTLLASDVTWQKWCMDVHAKLRWHYYSMMEIEVDETLRQLCKVAYNFSLVIEQIELSGVIETRLTHDVDRLVKKSELVHSLVEANEKIVEQVRWLRNSNN